jgi:tRNA uridine 5-carboxymethylaminomethyl modification enzyme
LPFDVQLDFIHTIEGLENAKVLRPGYGIEHGLIEARQLHPTLEAKKISGLYFAGQVNGTTGYEEAASQGIIAGINAALKIKKEKHFILDRSQAFIGVLIDELTSKGTDEPYRMFTSRSEFRLSLRETNADIRLIPLAYKLGLLTKEDYDFVQKKRNDIESQKQALKTKRFIFEGKNISLFEALKRPKVEFKDIEGYLEVKTRNESAKIEAEIEAKYEGFLSREEIWLKELKNLERIKLPRIDFSKVASLSKEVIEKLDRFKPATLRQALNISGITPAAIVTIYNFIRKRRKNES